ncbi:MAG: glycosyltransferase family 4 protein [Telmatospirillum sp.]|nr:glycosyltransferase family 4 protein [Telmatospirillum sp.]
MPQVDRPRLAKIAFIGNSLPRRCGIATFTCDIHRAVQAARPFAATGIVAMNDGLNRYRYPAEVVRQIADGVPEDYAAAAAFLNRERYDVVSLQHEFGIFGGSAGAHILVLLELLAMPVVTTFHTVLAEPSAAQREAVCRIGALSAKVIVMAEKGVDLLVGVYGLQRDKIEFIPHGIPDVPFAAPDAAKKLCGYADRKVVLTFGLLSANKGIETMIDAMPQLLERCPSAVYIVLGATHPNLVRNEGEAYREALRARARKLGVADRVVFEDGFVDHDTLLTYISMCDVYVTPYLNAAQMTSGTLAYSFGLGRAVVSTPYWHARELLADGGGVLVPFGDPAATGNAVAALLTDDSARDAMRGRAYRASRSMVWARVAERYLAAFEESLRLSRAKTGRRFPVAAALRLPGIRLGHFYAMCDDTGLFQHALHSIPDRAHGYCVDDNARALILAVDLAQAGMPAVAEALGDVFAAFLQHAWNAELRRFRNFMGFDRQWREAAGSEDSHGRALWALGVCASRDPSSTRRAWAAALFAEALPTASTFVSPRAWAFALLGIDAARGERGASDAHAGQRDALAGRLAALFAAVEAPDWRWFEAGLSYDNARLAQALIDAGRSAGNVAWIAQGVRALRWLAMLQTAPRGHFRPVGTESFGELYRAPRIFDQQPLEATATISAAFAAWRATGDADWLETAKDAFLWFHGRNDLGVDLVDAATGACRDGLHADRANENRGGESAVSYLLALVEMQLAANAEDLPDPMPSSSFAQMPIYDRSSACPTEVS